MPLVVKDLATNDGVQLLAQQLATTCTPEQLEKIKIVVTRILASNPQLANIPVVAQKGLNNAFYNFKRNSITTGLLNSDVIGHELGHAINTQNSDSYQKVLLTTRGLSALERKAAIPVMLGLKMFASDPTRKDILRTLTAASVANAAPQLHEEASASFDAFMNSPDKIQSLKTLIPALASHTLATTWPSIAYSIAQRL